MLVGATGRRLPRDLGERAASEIMRDEAILPTGETALLLSDDRDARRLVVVDPGAVILLTTWDYLIQLKEAQRIQSAAAIMEAVLAEERHPPNRDLFGDQAPEMREAVRQLLTAEEGRSGS